MAQVVIFAPTGEDVSAGENALREAGHDVEVVEATAENLLHMAIGMLDGKKSDEPPADAPAPEDTPEEPEPEEDPLADAPSDAEDPKKMESLGNCMVDGEVVRAVRGRITRLFAMDLQRGEKTSFSINESVISTWDKRHHFFLTAPNGTVVGANASVHSSMYGYPYIEIGPELYSLF